MKEIDELLKIMATLRDPVDGCPWDREQDITSILPYTIEEVYELAEAIQDQNMDSMRDELGDLLFQIIFYSQISSEEGGFTFTDIVTHINEKMKRRHPHVFGDEKIHSANEQSLLWERIKTQERELRTKGKSRLLDGISPALPALIHSLKLQKKAATVGFDWDAPGPVFDKIEEELEEVRMEINDNIDRVKLNEEIGDVLFACVNLARHLEINPETALMSANRKFQKRFAYIESQLTLTGRSLEEASLEEMENLWDAAKINERH